MDELLEMFNSFIGEALDYERAMDAEFVELEKKLSECVSLAKERGTPVQNKKRPKRQASLSEKEEEASGKSAGEEEEQSEARTSTNDRSTTGGTGKSSSARMLDVSGGKGAGEKQAPQPMDTTTSQANESSVRPSRTARLKAQEKLKEPAIGSKLRNDGGTAVTIKLERNSSVANSTLVRGGKEALVAMEKTTLERTYVEMETENDANRANRIISPAAAAAEKRTNDEGFSSANEASQKEPAKQAGKSERDMSLLVVPPVIPKVEIVSDEEMPPPSIMPPPKLPAPKVRTKKKPPVGEKGAKDISDTASSSAVSSADSTMNSTASSVRSSVSNSSSTTAKNRVGRPTRTKTKQTGKQVEEPLAAEAPSKPTTPPAVLMDVGVLIEPMRIKAEKLSIVQQQPAPADRTSDKSNYEDAQEQQEPMEVETTTNTAQLQSQMRPLKIALQKIPSHELPQQAHVGPSDMNGTYTTGTAAGQPIPSDGTFTMPPSIHDGTFTVNSPMENARGAPICNETFNIPAAGGTPPMAGSERHPDDTYVIEKSGGSSGGAGPQQQQHVPLANASIMTEDDSVVENSPIQPAPEQLKSKTTTPRTRVAAAAADPPPVPGPKPQRGAAALKKSASAVADAKKNKELFNPCVMSPIKSRIEAFEKCATATGGPAASKIGTPQAQIGRLMKTVSTPTLGTTEPHGITRSAHAKPYTSSSSSSSVYTPNCAAQPPMPKAASASKIGQMQSRALYHGTTSGGGGGAQSHSRDSSWDRAGGGGGSGGTLSAASSTSSLLDEKKKKREEKQRLAAAQREAMEREKREHAERLVREKEEKYRKLVQEKQEKLRLDAQKKARKLEEFEKRRQAEEQKTLADQKRDELAKQLADQERINRELLDTLKQNQTKDAHETKLHKQLYQQKLRQQQQQLEKQHHQQQLAAKKKLAGGAAGSSAASKKLFTFEMIDTDDSTDEEVSEDTSAPRKKQRPPLPEWCQKTADFRKQLQLQAQLQSSVIDRLFSVQPMTPDLRLLFPSIDAQKLKRNSSAIWRTPPRHSQLP